MFIHFSWSSSPRGLLRSGTIGASLVLGVLMTDTLLAQDRTGGRSRDRQRASDHPYQASSRPVRLPDLGQRHPVLQLVDLPKLVAALSITEENEVVIEILVSSYQDDFRTASAAYQKNINELQPDNSQSEELETQRNEARAALKSVREEFDRQRRSNAGEEDLRQLRQVMNQSVERLQEQMLQMERARLAALDWSTYFNTYLDLLDAWMAERKVLRESLETQLSAFLEPAQRELLPSVLSELAIDATLGRSEISGEGIDLAALLRSMVVPDDVREAVAPVIEAWSAEVAAALRDREVVFEDTLRQYLAAGAGKSVDGWISAAQTELVYRENLRELNLRYLDLICEALGPEHGPIFRERVLTTAFPSVYARGRILRACDELLKSRTPLEPAMQAEVETLRSVAAEWMYAFAQQSQSEWYAQEANRLLNARLRLIEQLIPPGEETARQWRSTSTGPREELQRWEQATLDQLRDIVGETRYNRLSMVRAVPSGERGRGRRGRR